MRRTFLCTALLILLASQLAPVSKAAPLYKIAYWGRAGAPATNTGFSFPVVSSEQGGQKAFGIVLSDGQQVAEMRSISLAGDGTFQWGPDGQSIALVTNFASGHSNGGLCVANLVGNTLRLTWVHESSAGVFGSPVMVKGQPSWSPDGRSIAYERGNLYTASSDGLGKPKLLSRSGTRPSWSPRGDLIAYVDIFDHQVHLISPDGSVTRQLTHDSAEYFYLFWSPDGRTLACIRDLEVGPNSIKRQLCLIGIDGYTQLCLFSHDLVGPVSLKNDCSWSRDGKMIALCVVTQQKYDSPEIYVVNIDGTGLTRLTKNGASDQGPCWTPDGKIMFTSDRAGGWDIYTINPDGSQETKLFDSPTVNEMYVRCY